MENENKFIEIEDENADKFMENTESKEVVMENVLTDIIDTLKG